MTSKRRNRSKKKSNNLLTDIPATTNMADPSNQPNGSINSDVSNDHLQDLLPNEVSFVSTTTSTPIAPSSSELLFETEIDLSLKQIGTETSSGGIEGLNREKSVDIDNNSLLNALQAQNSANISTLNSMVTATITGAIFQLKSELKSEFNQALGKQHSDLLTLKQNTTDQISKIDLKVTSNIGEMNKRVNSLTDSVSKINKVVTNSNLYKVDSLLSDNAGKMKEISEQYSDLEKRVTNCERMEKEFLDTISFMNGQLDDAKAKIAKRDDEIARINSRCEMNDIGQSRLGTRVEGLEVKSIASDTRQRKLNLIFDGVVETPNENTKGVITNIFNSSGGLANPADIDIAYRLCKPMDNNPRPILVSFHTLHAKDTILKNAPKIKTSANLPNLWINRDHPDITRRQLTNTRRCYNQMKANGHRCQLQGTSITYAGRVYHYKDLNNLPAGSRLEDTRMITCNNETEICFQGELAYLSNFYKAPFIYKEKPFTSAEQAFQWMKATTVNRLDTARQILSLEDPHTIKQIGSELPTNDTWT